MLTVSGLTDIRTEYDTMDSKALLQEKKPSDNSKITGFLKSAESSSTSSAKKRRVDQIASKEASPAAS